MVWDWGLSFAVSQHFSCKWKRNLLKKKKKAENANATLESILKVIRSGFNWNLKQSIAALFIQFSIDQLITNKAIYSFKTYVKRLHVSRPPVSWSA